MSCHLEPERNLVWVSKLRSKEHEEDTELETPMCASLCEHTQRRAGPRLSCGGRLPCLGVGGVDDVTSFQPPPPLLSWVGGRGGSWHWLCSDCETFTYSTSCNSHRGLARFLIPLLPKGKLGFPECNWLVLVHRANWASEPGFQPNFNVFPSPCSSHLPEVTGVPWARTQRATF